MSEALAIPDDAALFNDAEYTKAIQERTKAVAREAFHGRGLVRLIRIADGPDDKAALSAITLLGKLAGEFKAPKPVMLSFDELMRMAQQRAQAGPLDGMTEIREAEIIDGDEDT